MQVTEEAPRTREYARELTDRVNSALEAAWRLIAEAWRIGAWRLLGYASWDEYVRAEFDAESRLRVPRQDRHEAVASMRQLGMSTRNIASALGVAKGTVDNDLSALRGGQKWPADGSRPYDEPPVRGEDGHRYAPSRNQPRPAKATECGECGDTGVPFNRMMDTNICVGCHVKANPAPEFHMELTSEMLADTECMPALRLREEVLERLRAAKAAWTALLDTADDWTPDERSLVLRVAGTLMDQVRDRTDK